MSDKSKTVQDKMAELASLVAWFSGSDFELDSALDKFKLADNLALEIEKDLTELKNEIKVVKQKFDSEE